MKSTGRTRSASQFFGAALIMALGALAGEFMFSAEPARATSCNFEICQTPGDGCGPTTNAWNCELSAAFSCATVECEDGGADCGDPECIE